MSLFKIAWRSIQQRALASALTGFSMALGVALVVIVLVVHHVVADSFQRNAGLGYDIIIGAKGGKLQLVLNTVFHLSTPVENIPYSLLKEFTEGQYKGYVERAIPVCLGDQYEGHRVVATVPQYLEGTQFDRGRTYEFGVGRNFTQHGYFEGVIGSLTARQTGLQVGDTFSPTHGVRDDGQGHKHDPFTVVGILRPTGTPNDRAIFINMEGFYLLTNHAKPLENAAADSTDKKATTTEPASHETKDDHDHAAHDKEHDHEHDADHDHEHEPLPENQRELTAILLETKGNTAGILLPNRINEGQVAQAVLPVREIRGLFDVFVEPIQMILLALTLLIVIVSGIGIMVSIYNSMNDRRREIAVMRALGARRATVMTIILLESIAISLAGGMAGWLLGHGLIGILSPLIAGRTGVLMGGGHLVAGELALIPGLILLATAAGYLPAMTAYRTDVSRALVTSP